MIGSGLERASAIFDSEKAAGVASDGREATRQIAKAMMALRTSYRPCARCRRRSASVPDAATGDFVCQGCKRRRSTLSVDDARRRLEALR